MAWSDHIEPMRSKRLSTPSGALLEPLPIVYPYSAIRIDHQEDIFERTLVDCCMFTIDEARIRLPQIFEQVGAQR